MADPGSGAGVAPGRRRALTFGPQSAQVLIELLIALKLLVTAWNAFAFNGSSYDYSHHAGRAMVGGLMPGKMNYDPPLYYLPALLYSRTMTSPAKSMRSAQAAMQLASDSAGDPRVAQRAELLAQRAQLELDQFQAKLMDLLRATNLLYLAVFYVCWCRIVLPRLLPDWRSCFLASTLLLAMPGYQKLGVMSHADNLFAASAALCTAFWIVLHERYRKGPSPLPARYYLGLAALAGVVGLSRPFAVVPVAVFSLVAASHVLRGRRPLNRRAAARLFAVAAIVGAVAVPWYAYRWQAARVVLDAYDPHYIARYEGSRKGFDYLHYFTSFDAQQLWRTPNRRKAGSDGHSGNDSFFSVLYSEVWGDHWLYFSGMHKQEGKLWEKRVLFAFALPVVPWLLIGGYRSLRERIRSGREALAQSAQHGWRRLLAALAENEREAVLALWLVTAVAVYLYWQAGPALLPGRNSTIKFIYTATFYPLVIALAASWRPGPRWFNASAIYLLALYCVALPVAVFVPH